MLWGYKASIYKCNTVLCMYTGQFLPRMFWICNRHRIKSTHKNLETKEGAFVTGAVTPANLHLLTWRHGASGLFILPAGIPAVGTKGTSIPAPLLIPSCLIVLSDNGIFDLPITHCFDIFIPPPALILSSSRTI